MSKEIERWQDLATCAKLEDEWADKDNPDPTKRTPLYLFFEGYESDEGTAKLTDAICLSCPVMKQCFEFGVETAAIGVHGGVYLNRGNIDKTKNSHKTQQDWKKVKRIING